LKIAVVENMMPWHHIGNQEVIMNETEQSEHKLILRGLRRSDYPDIKTIMDRVYKGMGGAWTQNEYETLIQKFSEGQICIEDNGHVVAAALAILVNAE
jgi:hypothetical protein